MTQYVNYNGFRIPKGEADFLWAVAEHESGNSYTAHNAASGAIGKYQVLPSNVAEWTKEALGHSLTPEQYASDPHAQDAVAVHILGKYYREHGVEGAASIWYTGAVHPANYFPGGANTETVGQYARALRALMGKAPKKFRAPKGEINFGSGGNATLAGLSLPTNAASIPSFLSQHVVWVIVAIVLLLLLRK